MTLSTTFDRVGYTSRNRQDKKVGQVGGGISSDFSKDTPPNAMKHYKYSLNGETMFPNVVILSYFFGYVRESALQITSIIQMSIVVDGWGKCTWWSNSKYYTGCGVF